MSKKEKKMAKNRAIARLGSVNDGFHPAMTSLQRGRWLTYYLADSRIEAVKRAADYHDTRLSMMKQWMGV